MRSFPLPVRVAAGLAATAFEQIRHLPNQLVGLPLTVTSQALQLSMRVQQQVTELAIRGDDVLCQLSEPEETPEWATFDEDQQAQQAQQPQKPQTKQQRRAEPAGPGVSKFDQATDDVPTGHDRVNDLGHVSGKARTARAATAIRPNLPPDYDQLTLPQLRGKLRRFSEEQLADLLDHEREHQARPEFLRLLTNRLDKLRTEQT